jgi:hypothetical protein
LTLAGSPVAFPILFDCVRNCAADSLDIYVTTVGEKTVLAGPTRLDAATGDVFEAIIYDNVDPAIVDFVLVPLP